MEKEYIKLVKLTDNNIKILFYDNKVHLGNFIRDIDGFFYWDITDNNKGLWSDYILKEIVNKLLELNSEYKDLLSRMLNND